MMANRPGPRSIEQRDFTAWLAVTALGLVVTGLAVRGGARLGTASAPFLGAFRFRISPATLVAALLAAAILVLAARGVFERMSWPAVLGSSYAAALSWALALALNDGPAGLSRWLLSPDDHFADVTDVGDDPLGYLSRFTAPESRGAHTAPTLGHPPGPVLLLWALRRLLGGPTASPVALGLLLTAVAVVTVPLVLASLRAVAGDVPARRFAPVLILAPYAVWAAVSLDAVVAALGAAMVWCGVRASATACRGPRAASWALACGLLLGVAALFSYAAPWLGLSVVCLYFARRRPSLNMATGLGAIGAIGGVHLLGFRWVDGLLLAHADYAARVEPHRSALWWSGISAVVLLLATGPPLVASLRKMRNTPAWPFLVGAGVAVVFSVLAGFARGGVEHAWLPFFPWLTVAAVAPPIAPGVGPGRQPGPPVPTPLLLTAGGAVTAIVIETVLATPW